MIALVASKVFGMRTKKSLFLLRLVKIERREIKPQ